MIDRTVFVTGAQRSGTTLLEKLLGAQRGVAMLSQPFPLLFTEAKRAFLGDGSPYPLGHLFRETRYGPEDLAAFLRTWRTSASDLEDLFARMESYSGQYTRCTPEERRAAFERISPGDDFAAVVSRLVHALAQEDAERIGSKETTCEEYVPALLDRGVRCVMIVRDPRDVVTSLNHGRGGEHAGAPKPTLFTVRQWRKSVAVALAMDGHPRFGWCRYEDLVTDPAGVLHRLAGALGLDGITVPSELRDTDGQVWSGNSSHRDHDGIGRSSVGAHRDLLPATVRDLVEAACGPELRCLGYETSLDRTDAADALAGFVEPYADVRPGLERDAVTPENVRIELERLERVGDQPSEDSRGWFVFAEAHAKLRAGACS